MTKEHCHQLPELSDLQARLEEQIAARMKAEAALTKIAGTAEQYNYIGWQRIVGVMQKIAEEALETAKKV